MRFFHLSDTHLGKRDRDKRERFRDNGVAMKQVIDSAIKEHVDFIVHSGDLFDYYKPDADTILQAIEILKPLQVAKIPIFVIEGNHDKAQGHSLHSILKLLNSLGLIRLLGFKSENDFIQNATVQYQCPRTNEMVNIVGFGYLRMGIENGLKPLVSLLPNTKNLVLIHAGISGSQLVDNRIDSIAPTVLADLFKDKYFYIGMGHYHEKFVDENHHIYQVGSSERWAYDEKNAKFFFDVTYENGIVNVTSQQIDIRKVLRPGFSEVTTWTQYISQLKAWVESVKSIRDLNQDRRYCDLPIVEVVAHGLVKTPFDIHDINTALEPLNALYLSIHCNVVQTTYSSSAKKWAKLNANEIKKDILKGVFFSRYGQNAEEMAKFTLAYLNKFNELDLQSSKDFKDLKPEKQLSIIENYQMLHNFRIENPTIFEVQTVSIQDVQSIPQEIPHGEESTVSAIVSGSAAPVKQKRSRKKSSAKATSAPDPIPSSNADEYEDEVSTADTLSQRSKPSSQQTNLSNFIGGKSKK